jgi:lipoprotein-anchoring transpeptidase ErfK/SrfK
VLLLDGNFLKRYSVGTGRFDKTPAGEFIVTFKQVHPTWYRRSGPPVPFGDEANILGTRWLAIKTLKDPKTDRRGLGIHGTWKNESIGKSESAGCIRMRNQDVEELYAIVREGALVRIAEK